MQNCHRSCHIWGYSSNLYLMFFILKLVLILILLLSYFNDSARAFILLDICPPMLIGSIAFNINALLHPVRSRAPEVFNN